MKKYTWFNHLDRKNRVNKARCVIFYTPFMDFKKLHKWYKRFTRYIFKLVCIKSKIEPNINVKRVHEIFVSFGLHVGDSILVSKNLVFSKTIETEFSQGFEMTNNGENSNIFWVFKFFATTINIWYIWTSTNMC